MVFSIQNNLIKNYYICQEKKRKCDSKPGEKNVSIEKELEMAEMNMPGP